MGYWIKLEVLKFAHVDKNLFSLDLLAIANKDYKPLNGEKIQFYVSSDPIKEEISAKKGRASKKELPIPVDPDVKKLFIEAEIIGTGQRDSKFIDVPWPATETKKTTEQEATETKIAELKSQTKLAQAENELIEAKEKLKPKQPGPKEKPDCLSVTFAGKHGKQKLTISVSAADGSFIIGFVGTIVDGGEKKSFRTLEDGTAVYETSFQEESRIFEVKAGNTKKLTWRARLLGPER